MDGQACFDRNLTAFYFLFWMASMTECSCQWYTCILQVDPTATSRDENRRYPGDANDKGETPTLPMTKVHLQTKLFKYWEQYPERTMSTTQLLKAGLLVYALTDSELAD